MFGETARLPRHTVKVVELDAIPDRDALESAARWLERCVPLAAARLERPRFLRPYLRSEGSIDVDSHVERRLVDAVVPAEAHLRFERAVERAASEAAGDRLRRDRPLWSVTLIDAPGVERCAAIVRIHHAIADGGAFGRLLDAASEGRSPARAVASSDEGNRARNARRLPTWRSTLVDVAAAITAGVRSVAGRLKARCAHRAPRPFAGPRTRVNAPVSSDRCVRWTEADLEDVDSIAHRLQVSVNDVFLAAVSDACRRLQLGDRSGPPLVVAMPMAADRRDTAPKWWGNHVSNGFVSLADQIDDPVERARAIRASTLAAKELHEAGGGESVARLAELLTPGLVRLYRSAIRAAGRRAPVNLIVSNVRGPEAPIHLGPYAVTRLVSFGPLVECVGINVTMWSYAGRLAFGVHADAGQLRSVEVESFTSAINGALTRLEEAADEAAASGQLDDDAQDAA